MRFVPIVNLEFDNFLSNNRKIEPVRSRGFQLVKASPDLDETIKKAKFPALSKPSPDLLSKAKRHHLMKETKTTNPWSRETANPSDST